VPEPSEPALRSALAKNLEAWASEARRQIDASRELSARYGLPVHELGWVVPPPASLDDLADLVSTVPMDLTT
jgi:hypothetical protein